MPQAVEKDTPTIGAPPGMCLHCGSPIPAGIDQGPFCCRGCRTVHQLLREEGLGRYYDLAGNQTQPVAAPPPGRSFAWLEPVLAAAEEKDGPICQLELDVQGVHCAACVWLMNELYRRREGGAAFTVNPALGKVRLAWNRGRFDVPGFLAEIERFGYLFGPSRKRAARESRDLPVRLAVCAAVSMQVMIFYVAFYFGLAPADGQVFSLFSWLSLGLSAVAVAVGGPVFFRTAWQGIRRGVLHLDLPIALGILLAFGSSVWQARDGRGDLAYFDTINIFITLMLVGRYLQQRLIEKNRRFLLEDDGADGLFVRRREGEHLSLVRAPAVKRDDLLVIAPGDLVPVDGELLDGASTFSTDWITGEPAVRAVERGGVVPAGSFHAGSAAVAVRATTDFADSPLPSLLRSGGTGAASAHGRFWDRLARIYVVAVLALAALALGIWWPVDPSRAVDATVALLVVTCPCAIGLAVPLAYELALWRLRRAGFFVRSPDLLDKLPRVRKLLFDKTGTLTLGRLELADPAAVGDLPPEHRDAAYDMAVRSNHPVSRCLAEALARAGARFDPEAAVEERPGQGLSLRRGGHEYRLGAAGWAGPGEKGDTVLSRDGEALRGFRVVDRIRGDARGEMAALLAAGYRIRLVSGDDVARVEALAAELRLPAGSAVGRQTPEDKAALVAELDREDTLYLGDGINDSLAFERAFCAGTPAIDRPVLPGKSDFFLLGEGISGVRQALRMGSNLRKVVRRNLGVALVYNALAVTASLAGAITPLRAAVLMPLSSLTVILLTVASFAERKRPAEAQRPAGVTP
jgi:Cu2+-exporting ATPase